MSLFTRQGVHGLPPAQPVPQPAQAGQGALGSLSKPHGQERETRGCSAACPTPGMHIQGDSGARATSPRFLSNRHS